jgi:alpha-beta hydrolase superfamily lysophospholipase
MPRMSEAANFLSKVQGRKQELLFVNKKKQKNFDLRGAVASALPKPQRGKSFLLLFFKKEALAFTSLSSLLALAACGIPKPGPFYANQANQAAPHGTLIAASPFTPIPGAAAYRVVYNSESEDGAIVPVSGVIYIPTAAPPPGGRDIVAWAHPTTGIAQGCAPSLNTDSIGGTTTAGSIPGIDSFIAAGDIVAATDYEGLGEPGTHPYLIGKAEGQDIIDSVLAAKTLPAANPSGRFVVWGHSQGAQAALFAGQIAKSYAPQLTLLGVAAAAPVTDLQGELTEPFNNAGGRLLHAYVYSTWPKIYHVPITSVVDPRAVPAVEKSATKCLNTLGTAIDGVITADALNPVFLKYPPQSTAPWPALFSENSPGHSPPGAPLLILQGQKDPTVEPHWTESFVAKICARHQPIAYQEFPNATHLTIPAKSLPTVTAWIANRFAGKPAPDTCGVAG